MGRYLVFYWESENSVSQFGDCLAFLEQQKTERKTNYSSYIKAINIEIKLNH